MIRIKDAGVLFSARHPILFALTFGMIKSLESIAYDEVVTGGKSYAQLRKELKPLYGKVRRDIAKGHICLLGILAAAAVLIREHYFITIIALPVFAVMTGYILAYIHLFVHAAAHYELHPDKTTNDRISNLLVGVFFGLAVKKYRKIHWLHHTHLGTTHDSEHSYFNELNVFFLLKSITGIHTILVIFSRGKTAGQFEEPGSLPYFALYTFIFHSILLLLLWLTGGWLLVFTWLCGLLIIFPLFATIRQLMEHRDVKASGKINYSQTDHGKISRLFGNNLVDRSFGAAGFNKHLLHHWDPGISYTRLKDVERFLESCPKTSVIIRESKTSYFKTFIALFKF